MPIELNGADKCHMVWPNLVKCIMMDFSNYEMMGYSMLAMSRGQQQKSSPYKHDCPALHVTLL